MKLYLIKKDGVWKITQSGLSDKSNEGFTECIGISYGPNEDIKTLKEAKHYAKERLGNIALKDLLSA
jgi:hypothetical protein